MSSRRRHCVGESVCVYRRHLHPSSSLKGREPEWVCYGTIRMTSREYMMNVMCG